MILLKGRQPSRSLKALSEATGIKRTRAQHVEQASNTYIRWGHSVGNKLFQYRLIRELGLPCPEFTSNKARARIWLNAGNTVFARTLLNAHSGKGIIEVNPGDDLPDAPVYTMYTRKRHEFRIHYLMDSVILIQRKGLKQGFPSNKVRSNTNNYVFIHTSQEMLWEMIGTATAINMMDHATQLVKACGEKSGNTFHAVDVIWQESSGRYLFLEVNTSPGLENTTLEIYAEKVGEAIERGENFLWERPLSIHAHGVVAETTQLNSKMAESIVLEAVASYDGQQQQESTPNIYQTNGLNIPILSG